MTKAEAVFSGEHKCLNGVEVPKGMLDYIYNYISEYSDMDLFNEEDDVSLLNEFLNEFYYRVLENED